MASSHVGAYKNANRIDNKIKRRLRRSEEWQNKRDEEVNKRRNLGGLGLMTPCRELDVDLSMDSSVLEATAITPPTSTIVNKTTKAQPSNPKLGRQNKVETKPKQKNVKSAEASAERLKMLLKWKEEKALVKKQEALERAKHKPFVVCACVHAVAAQKTNFERKWEQEQQKKITKKRHVMPEAPPTRTRTRAASARSAASTTYSSQRTTRHTAAAQQAAAPTRAQATKAAPASRSQATKAAPASQATKAAPASQATKAAPASQATKAAPASRSQATKAAPASRSQATKAAPASRAQATKAAPASRTAPVTRATKTVSIPKPDAPTMAVSTRAASSVRSQVAAPKKALPKTTQTELVRRSTRASTKSDAKTLPDLPSTKIRATRSQKQKVDIKQTEAEPEQFENPLEEEDAIEPQNETKYSFSKKSVSFAPENYVFTAPEDLKSFDPSTFASSTLSPSSAHSFFSASFDHIPVDVFRSSNSPELKNFVTTRESALFKDKTEVSETCEAVQEDQTDSDEAVQEDQKDSDVGEFSSPKISRKTFDSPSLDKNVDVPNETPERKGVPEDEPIVEENVSVSNQEPELCEEKSLLKTTTPVRVAHNALFKTPVSQGPKTRRMRRSLSETRFVKEKPVKGNRRRRKTEMSRSPQTPEEWVELLKNSPMIEMTRRKIPKEKLNTAPLNLEFDDDDLIAANIIPPKDSSSNEVGEKLPEQTPQKEMESSEKIVSITESTPESGPEVASVEVSLVEPPVDLQPEQTAANPEDKTVEMPTEIPSTTVKHDVAYFRNLVKSQTDTLNSLAEEFEAVFPDVSGEVEGQIRTVIGQTKLLISKRFRQFIGLIDNCEYNTGEKETTYDDLQGFWDMVEFQVEDVIIKFEELKKLRENSWQPLENNPPVAKKPTKKLVKKAKPLAAKVNKQKAKSEFALFMAQKKKEAKDLELKVSSPNLSKTEQDTSLKVFDGFFFKVESPVKSPKPHCEEISRSPLVIPTFVETDRTVRLSPTITTISIVENGEETKVNSPKMAVCPEKEPPQMELKSPLSANTYSPLLPTKSFRRSFVPAVPSPLLQDITPNKRGRRSHKSFVFTDIGSPKTTVRLPEQNPEAEIDQEPAEKILVLQTPPLRRSGRVRRSVALYSPNVNKTPSKELVMQDFIKNVLTSESSSEGSQTSKDKNVSAQSLDSTPVFTPLRDGSDDKNSTSRQKKRRRRIVESQVTDTSPKRRRSTRISRKSISSYEEQMAGDVKENAVLAIKMDLPPSSEDGKLKRGNRKTRKSVAFSDQVSTLAIADSPSTVLCPVSPNVDITEDQQAELIRKSGKFQTLNVGFTPVRGSRPSLLYTPRRRSKTCEVEPDSSLMAFSP